MSSQRYSPEFKIEAVKQVTDRGYSVMDVAERLGLPLGNLVRVHIIALGQLCQRIFLLGCLQRYLGHELRRVIPAWSAAHLSSRLGISCQLCAVIPHNGLFRYVGPPLRVHYSWYL